MSRLLIALLCASGVALVASCSTDKSSTTGSTILGVATSLDSYRIDNDEIRQPLAQISHDLEMGIDVFVSRDAGHCVLCHQVDGLEAPFQGNLGPDLSDVGSRLTPAQLRFRIVDASRLNPATVMPPYYRANNLSQVPEVLRGKPVLSAAKIEHLVYFLSSLQGG